VIYSDTIKGSGHIIGGPYGDDNLEGITTTNSAADGILKAN
jgi:hypothetical protein